VNGAEVAGRTGAVVLVNFIAFLSLLEFVDSVLFYIGSRVGYDDLNYNVRWHCWEIDFLEKTLIKA